MDTLLAEQVGELRAQLQARTLALVEQEERGAQLKWVDSVYVCVLLGVVVVMEVGNARGRSGRCAWWLRGGVRQLAKLVVCPGAGRAQT